MLNVIAQGYCIILHQQINQLCKTIAVMNILKIKLLTHSFLKFIHCQFLLTYNIAQMIFWIYKKALISLYKDFNLLQKMKIHKIFLLVLF